MADISTETTSKIAAEVPDYPMARSAGCPLAPPPQVLALNAVKPLSRVRIWDGSTPWLITGYEAIRALFTDSRASVDDRRPGYPHWNEGMLATVDKRPRSVFTSDAEEHTRFRRMLSKPFTFKRGPSPCGPALGRTLRPNRGLKTFLLPLNPGNDDEGNMLDYACTAMRAVWAEIEESGLPVTHHIGETPPKAPCEVNNVAVAMMVNIDGFREMFSKYIFGGILDRHPRLRIGWFEGGIAWIPPALQDAEHVLASYQHMLDHPLEHDIRYYWDAHMSASFMVDPLGLNLIEQIGVDKMMWSSDYPHNESTFGYSEKSLAAVVEAVGPQNAARIVSRNIKKFLGV